MYRGMNKCIKKGRQKDLTESSLKKIYQGKESIRRYILNLIRTVVFKNSMNGIAKFASDSSDDGKMMLALGTLFLVKSFKNGVTI